MALPDNAAGYGDGQNGQTTFGFYTDEALTSVKLEAWDNDQTFPTLESPSLTTTTNTILAGTTMNGNKSMVCLVDTTDSAPSKCWKPYAATAGAANPNRLKGTTNYVERTDSSQSATERLTFNMVIEIPADVETTDSMGFELSARYTYTGSAPSPKFQLYDGSNWLDLTPGTHGIKHCRSGSSSSSAYADIPATTYVQDVTSQCSGLDDATSGGSHTGSTVSFFEVEVDSTGTPDTFKWRKNGGSYAENVSMTGSAQTLSDGVTITFAATTGHTLGDKWTITAGAKDTEEAWGLTS